ncbi:hypothetical protein [Myxococcus sp. AB025B]|uniref:hypothetical protein n=1 Tax=Myxococcus sp. AB025B TaxID=2562794 RepID=UPI0011420635|nr:hypothetical protein [Myxococcus sp. AB025B]
MNPLTRKLAERAAEWLEDPPQVSTPPNTSGPERYTAVLFRAFLAVLAIRLQRPTARISRASLCWRAKNGRVEHVTCEPFFCQSEESPHHPLLVRVLVNKVVVGLVSEVDAVAAGVARESGLIEEGDEPGSPPRWSLELAVFPGELFRFASYIADLVRASERDEDEGAVEPPMRAEILVESEGLHGTRALYVWSERAWDYFAARVWMDEIVPSNAHFMALPTQRRSARR